MVPDRSSPSHPEMLPLALLLPLLRGGRGGEAGGPRGGLGLRPPSAPLSPGSPAQVHEYQLQVQDSVTVQEGECLQVPCNFSYPGRGGNASTPVRGCWYREGAKPANRCKESKGPIRVLGDPAANNCSLSIPDPRQSDSGIYFFQVEFGGAEKYLFRDRPITVTVTALTRLPHIRVLEPLESGRRSRLMCSGPRACDRGSPRSISWTGVALRSQGSGAKTRNSSEITLEPGPRDHGTSLTCRVTLPRAGRTVERTVKLNVSYAPQNLTLRVFRGHGPEPKRLGNGSALPVLEGESLRLVCVADSNPPARLSWARGTQTLSPSPPSDPRVLELPRVHVGDGGEFTCRAENALGSALVSLSLSVLYPPQLLGPSCSWEAEGLRCSCSAQAHPAPSLRWWLGEGLVEGNSSDASFTATASSAGPWASSNLSLSAGLVSDDLRLSCEAQNALGAQSAAVLLLPGKAERGARFVQGAVWGAGAAALLSLCLCLVFLLVEACRRRAADTTAAGKDAPSVVGTTPQDVSRPGSPQDHTAPAEAAPTSVEEMELHYACLSFHGLRPREPQDQVSSTTEYAEIKICQ